MFLKYWSIQAKNFLSKTIETFTKHPEAFSS